MEIVSSKAEELKLQIDDVDEQIGFLMEQKKKLEDLRQSQLPNAFDKLMKPSKKRKAIENDEDFKNLMQIMKRKESQKSNPGKQLHTKSSTKGNYFNRIRLESRIVLYELFIMSM